MKLYSRAVFVLATTNCKPQSLASLEVLSLYPPSVDPSPEEGKAQAQQNLDHSSVYLNCFTGKFPCCLFPLPSPPRGHPSNLPVPPWGHPREQESH